MIKIKFNNIEVKMKRQDVKTEYKWKTEDLYATDAKWEEDFKKAQNIPEFSKYSGKLSDKKELLKFLRENDEYSKLIERLIIYAHICYDEDKTVAVHAQQYAKIFPIYTQYSSEVAFFEPEMAKLDDKYLESVAADSDFSDYDYQIKTIIKRKAHTVSEAEERIVSMCYEVFNSFSETFSMIDNLDLAMPEIEYNGETVKLTHGLYGIILRSNDKDKRKEAYDKYYAAYASLLNTISSTYIGNVKSDVLLSKVYKYDSCLDRALANEDVDRKVYENLLKAVDDNLSSMHRYVADRKKLLGCDKLYFSDVNAPLVGGVDFKLSYDEAYSYVIRGLAALGEEYQHLLRKAYNERWIDVEETEGKRNGAYSTGCYGAHPYVLLNYNPTINEVFTIAHEMGHSMHTYFSQESQPYAKSQYKIFVAEVASTVNEVLLLKFMLSEATDINLKKYLLNYYLDSIRSTLHRQTMFAEFESEAHAIAERGEPLTKDVLCNVYREIGKKYYGDAIEHDDNISFEWARVPHFYSSFYVYKYATGITAAINIASRILTEGQSAVNDYFKFLRGGSSTDPVSLLKLAGVDLSKTEPFEFAMKEFDKTLTEFEKLMEI